MLFHLFRNCQVIATAGTMQSDSKGAQTLTLLQFCLRKTSTHSFFSGSLVEGKLPRAWQLQPLRKLLNLHLNMDPDSSTITHCTPLTLLNYRVSPEKNCTSQQGHVSSSITIRSVQWREQVDTFTSDFKMGNRTGSFPSSLPVPLGSVTASPCAVEQPYEGAESSPDGEIIISQNTVIYR